MTAPRPRRATDSPAVRGRIRQLAAQNNHRLAVAGFRAHRAADEQARTDALILEAVAALAELLGTPKGRVCPDCKRALSTRSRVCPHCRDAARPAEVTAPAEPLRGAA